MRAEVDESCNIDRIANTVDVRMDITRGQSLHRCFIADCFIPIFTVMQDTAVVTREVLSDIAMNLNVLPLDTLTAVAHYALEKIQPRVMSFEEQV